ncbi:MAG: [FeFe] hydrogenase H-cluster maturation GTPase HydF [Gammaproteobacteria bacterium]|nr:[FeFe] hydrogenase H-cluster maturation GTPase HydF [Gammaproteobacteria bacterium]
MQATPKGFRLHIGIFGRRNVGKSSLLNAITRQNVSIVSNQAGTTTDPVEKPMELLPLGPVLFIDTAGVDDEGALGELRIQKTKKVFDRTDLAIIVTEANHWGDFEENLLQELRKRKIPVCLILNKVDLFEADDKVKAKCAVEKIPCLELCTKDPKAPDLIRQLLIDNAPEDFINNPAILRDLLADDDFAILVTPIDKEAPKGRLILPEVQTIRDLLDGQFYCIVTQQQQLPQILNNLKKPPKIVVTDSQCFKEVSDIVPKEILVTGFSVLFSRFKADLTSQAIAAITVDKLKIGDRVLIAEACSHHPIKDDIGREKIPRWLENRVGGKLNFTVVQGLDFPEDLADYKLVIHCGACMFNRRLMLNRILTCRDAGVPFTNYGLVIAYSLGIFDRALAAFPETLCALKK